MLGKNVILVGLSIRFWRRAANVNPLRSLPKSPLLVLAMLIFLVQVLALHLHLLRDPGNRTLSVHVHMYDGAITPDKHHVNETEIKQTGITGKIPFALDKLLLLFCLCSLLVFTRPYYLLRIDARAFPRSLYRFLLPQPHAPPL
jgi:hypothetical protein